MIYSALVNRTLNIKTKNLPNNIVTLNVQWRVEGGGELGTPEINPRRAIPNSELATRGVIPNLSQGNLKNPSHFYPTLAKILYTIL